MKFGGTSVESAEAIERVAGIVRARLDRRPVVVVSAMGKTTNKLLAIAAAAVAGRAGTRRSISWRRLRAFHLRGSRRAWSEAEIDEHFHELAELVKGLAVMGELTPRATDAISSYGERISSVIVAALFRHAGIRRGACRFAQRDCDGPAAHAGGSVVSGDRMRGWRRRFRRWRTNGVVVMGGFIGATEDGVTTTLGRGGSDYTASIVGAGIGAEEIQIWTDVDGMLTADPTILAGGYRVKTCSFAEAAELAYFGAKVLHPATVLPAIEKNIPVRILNSRRPEVEGTLIVAEAPPCSDSDSIDRVQEEHHAGEYRFDADADGAWIFAADFRGFRPVRDAGGHAGDVGGERFADHRQYAGAGGDSRGAGDSSPRLRSKRIRRLCAWWATISAILRAWRRGFSRRLERSMCE